ncbi:MAG TPA: double zinc ribbon domain-containing protein [Gemmatimonadales bacterium]|nr:double zinc ribbon domain-containing protein [Gemmatimonadales bacterium]
MREAVEQLLLPAECALCHTLLSFPNGQRLVCDVCRHRWRQVRPPWCERCAQPEPHFGPCRACTTWPRALRAVRSAVWLEGGARDAVHALKYGGFPRIADDLADAMARLPLPERVSACLVPVPLGPRRLRERGYNQSAHLGRALARRWHRPVADLLVRVRDTGTQTALTPDARLANVAGAFAMRNTEGGMRNDGTPFDSAFRIPHSALVLVDDVFTTGATLAEAARALERAGARTILAVTFGRAVLPDFT